MNDSFAEERYRIKYGRNTLAEEFRQAAEKAEPTTVMPLCRTRLLLANTAAKRPMQ